MKMLFLLLACTTVIINFGTCTATDNLTKEWEEFKNKYNKTYGPTEEEKRKSIFISNTARIKVHNEKFEKREVTFNMGMNKFGDLTHEEFLNRFSVREVIQKDANVDTENDVHAFDNKSPVECNWRTLEVVNKPVHDQLSDQLECKTGWAYSAADALAARYQIRYNKSCAPLCIKYLIKCSDGMGNHGCDGGLAQKACELVEKRKAMPDEISFKDNCSLKAMKNTIPLKVENCKTRRLDKIGIPNILCKSGPMSASISAEGPSFQFAKEGIYYDYDDKCNEVAANHEVLLVGHNGTDENNGYWIIKNSFGTSWGDGGFLKIATKPNKAGCRIISSVSYPEFS